MPDIQEPEFDLIYFQIPIIEYVWRSCSCAAAELQVARVFWEHTLCNQPLLVFLTTTEKWGRGGHEDWEGKDKWTQGAEWEQEEETKAWDRKAARDNGTDSEKNTRLVREKGKKGEGALEGRWEGEEKQLAEVSEMQRREKLSPVGLFVIYYHECVCTCCDLTSAHADITQVKMHIDRRQRGASSPD